MRFPALFRAQKPRFEAAISPETPFCAIGDIHGRSDLLRRALDSVPDDFPLIFVGDYADRGDDSKGVLAELMARCGAEPERIVCLIGNHESFLLDFLKAPQRIGPSWMRHGGLQTLGSFGVQPPVGGLAGPEDWDTARDALGAAMGPEMIAWLSDLPAFWRSGNVAVVHAGADPSRAIEEQSANDLMWGHPDFGVRARQDGLWIVHGHTIVAQPAADNGIISIDTGAFATGRLTVAYVDTQSVEFSTVTL